MKICDEEVHDEEVQIEENDTTNSKIHPNDNVV